MREVTASGMSRWHAVAYLARYAIPLLDAELKSEAERLLPYLALGRLRRDLYGYINPLAPRQETPAVLIVDVGAFDGEFLSQTVRLMAPSDEPGMSRATFEDDLVLFAIEPSPWAHAALLERAKKLRWGSRFCAVQVALSQNASDAHVKFATVPETFPKAMRQGSHLVTPTVPFEIETEEEVQVARTTLDTLFEEGRCGLQPQQQIYLLKVDCEGHDWAVLYGARKLIKQRRVKYLLFEHGRYDGAGTIEALLRFLWRYGYGCFLILDRFLVPVSDKWFHPAYRDKSSGGVVSNVDVFCAKPHDPDLVAVIEGYTSYRHAVDAKDAIMTALEDWKRSRPALRPSVQQMHNVSYLASRPTNSEGRRQFFLGDLFRHGYGSDPSPHERHYAMSCFRRAFSEKAEEWPWQAAALEIGTCYHFGDCGNGTVNLPSAIKWYSHASKIPVALDLANLARLEIEEARQGLRASDRRQSILRALT